MHYHSKTNPETTKSSLLKHSLLLGLGLVLVAGLYLWFRSINAVVIGGVAIVAAHIAAVGLVVFLGGTGLRKLMAKLHGSPAGHSHSDRSLKTEGHTINWPSFYDVIFNLLSLGKEKVMREDTIELARLKPGEKVLEVGCGTGSLAIAAKAKAGPTSRIFGTDPTLEMIEAARQKANQAGLDINFQTGLVENIDFPDDSFDLVLSSFMVHHLPGDDLQEKGFAEMYRVLKPGGRLVVVDFEPPLNLFVRGVLRPILGNMLEIDNSALPKLFEGAAFTVEETGRAKHWLASYVIGRKLA